MRIPAIMCLAVFAMLFRMATTEAEMQRPGFSDLLFRPEGFAVDTAPAPGSGLDPAARGVATNALWVFERRGNSVVVRIWNTTLALHCERTVIVEHDAATTTACVDRTILTLSRQPRGSEATLAGQSAHGLIYKLRAIATFP